MLREESEKKIRDMLCVHQLFRRVPKLLFENPGSRLWDKEEEAVKALLDDKDLNMDFQWKQGLNTFALDGIRSVTVSSGDLENDSRPENPRIAEAYNMVSLRPSVSDMEQNTSIFVNAVKEYPTLPVRDALYKACREIYVAVDRDLFLFISEVDKHYGTDFAKNSMDYILETKREDNAYRKAENYLDELEAAGCSAVRKSILDRELEGYMTAIAMNRYLPNVPVLNDSKNVTKRSEYQGMDISWADKRSPSKEVMRSHFAKALYPQLEEMVGKAFMKNDPLRRSEAMLDRADRRSGSSREETLLFFAPEILYGAGYVRLKEKEATRSLVPKEQGFGNDMAPEGR